MPRPAGNAVFTPTLLTCVAISAVIHVAVYTLNVVLPLHVAAMGGSETQVGLLFSVYPTLVALVVDRTPERERGLATGTLSGSFDAGIVVGSALIGAVVEHASFGAGFLAAAAAAVAGLTFFAVTERRRGPAALVSPGPVSGV